MSSFKLISILLALAISGCSTVSSEDLMRTPPRLVEDLAYTTEPPERGKIVVAVYSYGDKTGQRLPAEDIASLSTAVTQGAESFVIDGLKEYSNGEWFRVVERTTVDNVLRERQIARSARETVEELDADPVPPMLYAGVLIEGAIVGYDSNVISAGQGARVFGLGAYEKYTQHVVTVALRAISVATSEILISVIVEKEVLSAGTNTTALIFFDLDRETLEAEAGMNENEAPTHAVRLAIDKAIHEMVLEGKSNNIW